MSAPKSVKLNPNFATDFFVQSQNGAVVIQYKFWIQRAGDKWYPIGPESANDQKSDHWIFTPPMPDGSVFAYWLGLWGHANEHWVARLQILQRDTNATDGAWSVCGDWTEEGDLSDEGNGGGVGTLPSIPQVTLTN